MIFSTETIKSAINNKSLYKKKNNKLESSYYINEAFNVLDCDPTEVNISIKDNFKDDLKLLLLDYQGRSINIFSDCIDGIKREIKYFSDDKKYSVLYNKEVENKVLNYLSKANDTIDISNTELSPTKFIIKFESEIFLLELSRVIDDLKLFITRINELSSKDAHPYNIEGYLNDILNNPKNINDLISIDKYEFTSYYSDNRSELTVEEIYCRDLFDTANYPNKLFNKSQYIISYFNKLATMTRDIPNISLSDKYSTVIKSKLVAVVDYKLKLIQYILNKFDNYCRSYCNSVNQIADQNLRIIDLLYNMNQNMSIYTDGDFDKEEEELYESLYNAYKEAYNGLSELDTLVESVGLIALDEAGDLKIVTYVKKVFESISKAWNSFKGKMEDLRKKAVNKFTNKFIKEAKNLPDDLQFEVRNLPTLAEEKFNMVKVIPFNYTEMKEYLGSIKQFVTKYYPNVTINDGEHFKTALERYLIKDRKTERVTKQYILDHVIPILETSDNVLENSLKTDIDTLNKSSDAMNNLTNNSTEGSTTTTTTTTNNTSSSTNVNTVQSQNSSAIITNKNSNIIIEADGDNKNTKIEIVDDENRTAAVNKQSILKEVSVYLTVSSSILSTKMKLIRQKEVTAFRILVHAFTPPKKKPEQNNNQEQK